MNINELNVDRRIIEIFASEGIGELYPPQAEAMPHVLSGKNVVLAIPTAAGKTLVAYIGMLQSVLARGGKALYITPLRALASEKHEELSAFEKIGLSIGISIGDLDASDRHLDKNDIIIATSEKADSLIRHKTEWLNKITVVVVDEVHTINDPKRGPTLEVILSRFKHINPDAQIIALSATIRNAKDLADWLGAVHVSSAWRPVTLRRGVFMAGTVSFDDKTKMKIKSASEPIPSLVADSLAGGGQALVFVNSRRSSEAVAEELSKIIGKALSEDEKKVLEEVAKGASSSESEPTSMCARLGRCILGGTAFHNAGLTNELRAIVERNFKAGRIKCIVATPTLAAGINLPARRVIVRDLFRYDANYGMQPLPVLEVHQMMGRAGRPKYDKYGEAVLLAKNTDEMDAILDNYIHGEPEDIYSKLAAEPALRTHILSSVAMGFIKNERDIADFIGQTFYGYNSDSYTLESKMDAILDFLEDGEFISREGDGISATEFGRMVSNLYIDPLSAKILKEALTATKSPSVKITPLSFLHAVCSTPDIDNLYLNRKDYEWTEDKARRRQKEFLLHPNYTDVEDFLSHIKTASVIEDWIDEKSEDWISNEYSIGPGDIRNKVERVVWMLNSMRELAVLFKAPCTKELSKTIMRTENGIKEELIELIKLKNVGRVRSRLLFDNGFKTVDDLRKADIEKLKKIKGIGDALSKNIKKQVGDYTEQKGLGEYGS